MLWAAYLFVLLLLLALVVWNSLGWPRPGPAGAEKAVPVSVLIPARNEESSLPNLLGDLAAQRAQPSEILVYDDHSADRTADVVRAAARDNPSLRLVQAVALPGGWCGKPLACFQLAQAARGEWLLFLDADVRLPPDALGRIAAEACRRRVTLLSCWPGIEMRGFAEKLFMPLLNFVVFTLFPAPLSLRMPLPALGLAHGACILMRREEYRRTGGHGLVKGELFEDTALARAWRAAGEKGICLDGQAVVRVRMYDSFGSIWRGFGKNIYPAFRRETNFWLFVLFHALFFLLPFALLAWAALTGRGWAAAGAGSASVLLMRLLQALRFRYPLWSALLHPVAEAGLLARALVSWYTFRTRGVEWKGRTYRKGGR